MNNESRSFRSLYLVAVLVGVAGYAAQFVGALDDAMFRYSWDEQGARTYAADCTESVALEKAAGVATGIGNGCPATTLLQLKAIDDVNATADRALYGAATELGASFRTGVFALLMAGISMALADAGVLAQRAGRWLHCSAMIGVGVIYSMMVPLMRGDFEFVSVRFYGGIGLALGMLVAQRPARAMPFAMATTALVAVAEWSMGRDPSWLYRAHYGPVGTNLFAIGDTVLGVASILLPVASYIEKHIWSKTDDQK